VADGSACPLERLAVSVRLIDAATGAVAPGLQVAAVTSAVLMLAMAVVAALFLRKSRSDDEPEVHMEPNPDQAARGRAECAPILAG
jgi:hypothetical protein